MERTSPFPCRYVYGDSTAGQAAMASVGLSGVPIINVNNNCCTGSTAIFTARQMVRAGHDCVLAVGFEKMSGNLRDTSFPQGGGVDYTLVFFIGTLCDWVGWRGPAVPPGRFRRGTRGWSSVAIRPAALRESVASF